MKHFTWLLALLITASACVKQQKADFSIQFEKYKLTNGLEVVLHQDKSDPVVAVAVMYHVGSNREVQGKTGFAHLFEHMLFQESENIPQDTYFKQIQDAGGTLNGFTTPDYTTYYEIVPKNALEKILWMEADRMGYFINTVTPAALVNQQNVVINEKRENYDNEPYGHTWTLYSNHMYPKTHPYNWTVIGEMADLKEFTVADVKEFYNKYYGPNNATLVIAGDFSTEEAKTFVEKYFGEIAAHGDAIDMQPMPNTLAETKRIYHEDAFAKAPELTLIWPGVEEFNNDCYALQYLSKILADGKKAPLYKVLVKEKKLTSNTQSFYYNRQLAGDFFVQIRANDSISLVDVEKGIFEAFNRFETEGITQNDIDRVKASIETGFYQGISSVYDKALQLSYYNTLKGDPAYIVQDIENIQSVTIDDVKRVYNQYIKDKPFLALSFVPKGQLNLMAANSINSGIVEEDVTKASEVVLTDTAKVTIEKTPSKIDRSAAPALSADPLLAMPTIWTDSLTNGLKIYGIEQNELPLVYFELVIKGGFLLDDIKKPGIANLITDALNEGTKNKTPEQLEEEIELLGASLQFYTSNEEIALRGSTLARNFDKTMTLVEEMLLEPRWDAEQFELAKTRTINQLMQSMADPAFIANTEFKKLVYGNDHIYSRYMMGAKTDIEAITIDDLKQFYEQHLAPNISNLVVAGKISPAEVTKSLQSINANWKAKTIATSQYPIKAPSETAQIYFYNITDAKQSVIKIGNISMAGNDPNYYAATVMNYQLGGSFSGYLNMILREEKGFTYGARSSFTQSMIPGTFEASASVRTNATAESVSIFKTEMEKYSNGISTEQLQFTQNALIKSNARRFETLPALVGMLKAIGKYNLPFDYIKTNEEIVKSMTLDQHKALAQKYVQPSKMVYLIVGDAKTQLEPLKKLGLGMPILINP